ncbi:hypothetical protein D7294_29665 [Streptomyces hoynatensis]|uniref:Uncharacterized protein n=1 Tax=Streptomyces hoynatensis TaxID=1141874 RepID=A0A3A9YIM1_9ACTN|nr:hypothetical protein D7294_29665 [Streptomyces hoynatensis]
MLTDVGPVEISVPGDRDGSFEHRCRHLPPPFPGRGHPHPGQRRRPRPGGALAHARRHHGHGDRHPHLPRHREVQGGRGVTLTPGPCRCSARPRGGRRLPRRGRVVLRLGRAAPPGGAGPSRVDPGTRLRCARGRRGTRRRRRPRISPARATVLSGSGRLVARVESSPRSPGCPAAAREPSDCRAADARAYIGFPAPKPGALAVSRGARRTGMARTEPGQGKGSGAGKSAPCDGRCPAVGRSRKPNCCKDASPAPWSPASSRST